MAFNENYYNNHLSQLYTGDASVYDVDPKLYSIATTRQGAEQAFGANDYFKRPSVSFVSESKQAAEERAKMTEEDFFSSPPVQEVAQTSVAAKRFVGLIDQEVVSAKVERGPQMLSYAQILSAIDDEALVPSGTPTHDQMDAFMRGILTSACKESFKAAQAGLNPPAQKTSWNTAQSSFKNMTEAVRADEMRSMQEVAARVLCRIATAKADAYLEFNKKVSRPEEKKLIPSTYLDDLKIGGFVGPLYHKIRMNMLKEYVPSSVVISTRNASFNKQATEYAKMILVDLFLKTCYPLLIFDYIGCMRDFYMEKGDFVNYRVASLARVMFVYYFHAAIAEAYAQGNTDGADGTNIARRANVFATYVENINADHGKIPETITTLHALSDKVSKKSQTIGQLKESIHRNQLAMRNVIYNTQELRKKYAAKRLEFAALVVILIILVMACSILVYFEKNLIALYVAGGVAIVLLSIATIRLIAKLVRRN